MTLTSWLVLDNIVHMMHADYDNSQLQAAKDAIDRGLTMGQFVREQDNAHDHKLTIDQLEALGHAYDAARRSA